MDRPTTDDILRKYSTKIESEISSNPLSNSNSYSKEYQSFKADFIPEFTRYEKLANSLSFIKLKLSPKEEKKIQKYLDIAHLNVSPSQAIALATFSFLITFIISIAIFLAAYFITNQFQTLFLFLGLLTSIFIFYYTYTAPKRLANIWRLKASSQMVPAILYIVVYMKHTSNLEKAIEFASQHLDQPLALDFRKIFWDVEISRFQSVKQSLEYYLETWRDYSPEFIESLHLIESSLYEPDDSRRVQTLEKALQVILDGVYEKMLSYSREIRSPLTNLYMLGIILPTLALALLPLASTLLQGAIQTHHLLILFNVIIPFLVFYMSSQVLLKRPGGHGNSSALELNPLYPKFTSKKPWFIAFIIALPLLLIGLLPFIFQISFLTQSLGLESDYTFSQLGLPFDNLRDVKIFDFRSTPNSGKTGPFGPLALLLSLFIPLSIGIFFSTAWKLKTRDLIKARKDTEELESEFTNSLFQLGNRLGDGLPAEIAISKVVATTQGQKTQQFFILVNQNIQQLGMSLENAVFNKKRGAIIFFPSALIATSMRILIESAKKGLKVAARSLMSISEYVKNIRKINERLRDILAEVISDMKSNMTFLAPLLAGIVVGLASMITSILIRLDSLKSLGNTESLGGLSSVGNILSLFDVSAMIPPYFLQVSIGIYIVEIIFILTGALVTVDAGQDRLREKNELSKNLKRGLLLYFLTSLIAIIALSALSSVALGNLG